MLQHVLLSQINEGFTIYIYFSSFRKKSVTNTLIPHLYCRDLVRLLGGAVAGIHSMMDEHFGICVVEYMAAGAIPIGRLFYRFLFLYHYTSNKT